MARAKAERVERSQTPSTLELMRDMDAHLAEIGIDPAAYPWYGGLTPARDAYPRRAVPAATVARWGRTS